MRVDESLTSRMFSQQGGREDDGLAILGGDSFQGLEVAEAHPILAVEGPYRVNVRSGEWLATSEFDANETGRLARDNPARDDASFAFSNGWTGLNPMDRSHPKKIKLG